MENFSVPTFCIEFKAQLKRQVLNSNVFYYCMSCRRMSSEVCFSRGSGITHIHINHCLPKGRLLLQTRRSLEKPRMLW